jgi:hypothetical protein
VLPVIISEFVDDSDPVVAVELPNESQKRRSLAILTNLVPPVNCNSVSDALLPELMTVVLIAGSHMTVLPTARPLC